MEVGFSETSRHSSLESMRENRGQDSALAGSGAGGWRRLCAFLCNYCLLAMSPVGQHGRPRLAEI